MNILKYRGKTVKRDFILDLWIVSDKMHPVYTAEQGEELCLQNTSFPAGGKLHIVALEKKVFSLGLSRSSLFTVSSCHHRHLWSFSVF